jgi:hypothetical protein
MTKKPSTIGRNNVRTLTQGNLEKRQLFEEVGRAIVHLSDIENRISEIYHSLLPHIATPVSMDIFYSQGGFEKKLNLASLIVQLQGTPKEFER